MFDPEKIARQCIVEADKYVPGKPIEEVEREYGIRDITKLASNENPFGPSPLALKAMEKELRENIHLYPESSCFQLRERLAEKFQLPENSFFIDNGLDGVITMLGLSFLDPGDEVLTCDLTFPAYKNISQKMNGVLRTVPVTADYTFDIEGIIAAIGEKTKMIFLCNPNNPTGTLVNQKSFNRLLEKIPETVLLVSDEAYFEFVETPEFPDTLASLASHKNLIILRTFSKIMGIAGIRIGYAIAHPEITEIMMKAREPFPVNRVAQAGALASLDDMEYMAKVRAHTLLERDFLRTELEKIGFHTIESHTNFVFSIPDNTHVNLYEDLLKRGIIIRPIFYRGKEHFRITVGTREENRSLIKTLKEIL